MKKSLLLTFGLLCTVGVSAQAMKLPELHFNPPPRKIKIDNKAKQIFAENGKCYFGIVVPEDAGLPPKLAAEELANFLGKALNIKVPVAKVRSAAWKHAIILGDSALSRKAGLDVSGLTRDGFLMKTVGNDLYIAGLDDKNMDTKMWISKGHYWGEEPFMHQRGTVFGAYDFLERFAGVRFYLPVKEGIIVPKLAKLEVPRVDIFDRPDCAVRTTTGITLMWTRPGEWIEKGTAPRAFARYAALRMRTGTRNIPNCHGLQHLGYWKRFGKSNPEYFVKNIKGQRLTDYPGFICLSSGIVNEIIEDAKSALRGEPPTKRGVLWTSRSNHKGVSHWFPMTYNKDGFFNVHLMDAMQPCYCDKCEGGKVKPGEEWAVSAKRTWQMTATVAKAIQDAKIPGWITQMGYNHYREVPAEDLPDNVIVQLAFNGPFQMNETDKMKYEYELVKRWNKKLKGRKVWFWIYLDFSDEGDSWCSFPGVSPHSPYTIAKYFQDQKGDYSGCMVEIHGGPKDWFNLNTCMRVMWDNNMDFNKYMEEFYSLMFGKAAPVMKSYFTEAEKIWIYKVRGASFETPLGPKPFKPSEFKIWEEYYPQKLINKWIRMFDQAEAVVKNSPDELARVKFFRKYYLGPVLKHSKIYWQNRSSTEILQTKAVTASSPVVVDGKLDDAAWSKAEKNYLGKFRFGGETPIRAVAKVMRDSKNLYFGFESIDPENKNLETGLKPLPGQNVVHFATFEVMLNPSNDKENVYQFMINPSGKSIALKQPFDKKCNIKYQVASHYGTDRWSTELVIPLDQIPELNDKICRANFAYNRRLMIAPGKSKNDLYSWSPYLQVRFYEPDRFGKIVFGDPKPENLLNGYDFADVTIRGRLIGDYWSFGTRHESSKIYLDQKNFVTGGQSVCMESSCPTAGRSSVRMQYYRVPKLDPGKKYRLSMYVKGELAKGAFFDARVWTGKTNVIPSGRLQGNFPWMKISGDFVAGPKGNAGIGIQMYGAGKVNVDHVVLQEVTD
ncbi:MAG: DUF4838 domain-containing protein [Lentisphaeria bacterium]|nr:DUF4838 domain-containing protein [Lentisphaeria bacterium]